MKISKLHFKNVIKRDFQSQFQQKSSQEQSALKSITLHLSLKEQNFESKKQLFPAGIGLQLVSGQKPSLHKSKKAVSVWRLVKGDYTGLSVVLRGPAMQDFFENLVEVILPSLKPFNGIKKKSLDKEGNLSFTIPNLFLFPQLEREQIHFQQGFNLRGSSGEDFKQLPIEINISTTAKNKKEGELFFSSFRIPLV